MTVNVVNGTLCQEEIDAYVSRAVEKYSPRKIEEMTLSLDGEWVDISYKFSPVRFDRIRRITGYLVGTLDRFNDAKRAEVEQRVKHSV